MEKLATRTQQTVDSTTQEKQATSNHRGNALLALLGFAGCLALTAYTDEAPEPTERLVEGYKISFEEYENGMVALIYQNIEEGFAPHRTCATAISLEKLDLPTLPRASTENAINHLTDEVLRKSCMNQENARMLATELVEQAHSILVARCQKNPAEVFKNIWVGRTYLDPNGYSAVSYINPHTGLSNVWRLKRLPNDTYDLLGHTNFDDRKALLRHISRGIMGQHVPDVKDEVAKALLAHADQEAAARG